MTSKFRFLRYALWLFLIPFSCCKTSVKQEKSTTNIFQITNPDYKTSPFTGMTRAHWIDAAEYLLGGAFSYIHNLDDPMKFPKQPGKSYPTRADQVPTEKLEGLCRTLFVAAPLLREDSSLVLNDIKVADYYRHQIENLLDSTNASYIVPRAKNGGPSQILVEFGALAISLFSVPEVIWDPLPQDKKDALAHVMLSYGDGPTVSSNWKFFNIFVLSFFKDQGYEVNESLLEEYLHKSLDDYRGEGWYNDNPAYDYYSMWAFQLYGALWNELFGHKYYPEIAQKFQQNFEDMAQNYPYAFSRDGKMIMWGRSISYRMASVAPLPFIGLLNNDNHNLGWLRRISSGVMLQFLQHPDFLKDSIPTLGFYGAFEPAVQIYSCRGSAFWMGKVFLGLMIPKENPFWTATENEGPWEENMEQNHVYNHYSPSTHVMITNYPNIGASEIRSWCHEKVADDWQKFRSTENYNRLSYNSAFPWQADGPSGEVAMNYLFQNNDSTWEALRLFTFQKFVEGTYYRNAVLETDEDMKIQLSEMPLPNGILRIDKNISSKPVHMRLGHYALPQKGTEITVSEKQIEGYKATIIDNGTYQLALVPLQGWENTEIATSEGLHPEAKISDVINVTAHYTPSSNNNGIYACLMLWKKSGTPWSEEELMPVQSLNIVNNGQKVDIRFKNNENKSIEF